MRLNMDTPLLHPRISSLRSAYAAPGLTVNKPILISKWTPEMLSRPVGNPPR